MVAVVRKLEAAVLEHEQTAARYGSFSPACTRQEHSDNRLSQYVQSCDASLRLRCGNKLAIDNSCDLPCSITCPAL